MVASHADDLTDPDVGYWFDQLSPRRTSLPITVWIRPSCGKAMPPYFRAGPPTAKFIDLRTSAVVSLSPEPQVIAGELAPEDLHTLEAWVRRHLPVLLDYWNGETDTLGCLERLGLLRR